MINAFSQAGFRLNNGMFVLGPMAIFPRTILSWNIENFEEINDKSLSLFTVLEPKIDVLVIGTGDHAITPQFSKNIIGFMRSYGINVEVLPTEQACTTFNFLNSEGRMVAAALLPPNHMSLNENDMARQQLDKNKIFEIED
jgi:NADH dehydrogenase [ubiquinone] 1 alpha subcomplex assembly factor 3